LETYGTIFAFSRVFGVTPDIVAIAEAPPRLRQGLPLGAFCRRKNLPTRFHRGQHGTNILAADRWLCRVALEFLAVVEEEKLAGRM